MDQREWWRADNLQIEKRRIREKQYVFELDPCNDDGSYRMLLMGKDAKTARIAAHNDVKPRRKIEAIGRLLRVTDPWNVLDVGCGVGYTTEALALHFPRAVVLGVDLSAVAIAFARRTHLNAEFDVRSVVPDGMALGRFDLIFCFEFYPFTSNSSSLIFH